MTRWAVVYEGKRLVVVPESKIGTRRLHSFYLGHREGAFHYAKGQEERERKDLYASTLHQKPRNRTKSKISYGSVMGDE